jgi:excisionase family DNA binding protein
MDKLLLRPEEVADTLGICRSRAYAMIAARELPSVKIGASVRVPADALKAWIEQRVKGAVAVGA